jgi:hypothetical protein
MSRSAEFGFNPMEHPVCLAQPRRIADSAWLEHIPFAMLIVDLLRPEIIVELGTHTGVSYCAFCQAVQLLRTETRCYAIDTWKGDPHAGYYDVTVLEELKEHHDPLYSNFSRLVQSTFNDALPHFADRSIDLLHIDGFHTYEAAAGDFFNWIPKMSAQGVVLLHDINVREREFGLWRLWEELKTKYPHFAFFHGHGLGLLSVGEHQPECLKRFLEASEVNPLVIRQFFHLLGRSIPDPAKARTLSELLCENQKLKGQVGELNDYVDHLQSLWLVRFVQVWANEGLSACVRKSLRMVKSRIFLPPRKYSW